MRLIIGHYITSSLGSVLFLWLIKQVIVSRMSTGRIVVISFLWGILSIIKAQNPIGSNMNLYANLSSFFVLFMIILFGYKEKIRKRIIVIAYFFSLWVFSDMIVAAAFASYYGSLDTVLKNEDLFLVDATVFLIVFLVLGLLSLVVWRRIKIAKFQIHYLLFLLLAAAQILFIYALLFLSWDGWWLFGIFFSLVADLLLLSYIIKQERRGSLEAELRELHHQMEIERAYYQELEKRQEELMKIRHDFNNQLTSIHYLMRIEDMKSAKSMIKALTRELDSI